MEILIAILVPDDEGPKPGNFKKFGCGTEMPPTPKEIAYLKNLCSLIDVDPNDPSNTISCSRINSEQAWGPNKRPKGWFKILKGMDKKWENNCHEFSLNYPDLKGRTLTLFPLVKTADHVIVVKHKTMNGMEEGVYNSIMKKVEGVVHEFMFQDMNDMLDSIPYIVE